MSGEEKICHYINRAFAGCPAGQQTEEAKEALCADLLEKYRALLETGYAPETAYQTTISGVGDIFEVVDSVTGRQAEDEIGYSSLTWAQRAKPGGAAAEDGLAAEMWNTAAKDGRAAEPNAAAEIPAQTWDGESSFPSQAPAPGSPAVKRAWAAAPFAAAGLLFLLWLHSYFYRPLPGMGRELPMFLLGAALGAFGMWVCLSRRGQPVKALFPRERLPFFILWGVFAILFLAAAFTPGLQPALWLIPISAVALHQILVSWRAYQSFKKEAKAYEQE
ncbi:hypothetical protein B5E84_11395 [Lachnoclostridium sp. An14]|uniref:hypothetical protein n=1 Tax=Lachnoclostridium sp. An14 TaxID=1965562 RepID=UPI000B388675|nr:hypothetical protein [Lachnoclostridium sp. An14]OUQ16817.1 hypothetical protein B5E84_11395 [Lachnoclostridium sp. An14]